MGGSARERVAARLRIARESAGLTQGQVARRMRMHRPTVSEIEAGRRRVSAEELAQFASLYGVSTSWLTAEREAEPAAADDRILLAARQLSKLKQADLDRLMNLIRMLRQPEGSE
jgi:transcriptional regulator with XRE-family HTH domain